MNSAAHSKKLFTPEQANHSLPLVRAIVKDIVELYQDVHERRHRLLRIKGMHNLASGASENVYSEELEQIEEQLDKDIGRLQEFDDELSALGVSLKDAVKGLVDFPAVMDGREVCLCWHLGEAEVSYWHEMDAGFAGRQSLLERSLSGNEGSDDEQEN